MIARSFRRLLNEFQETDLQVANAPAQTITSALNHIFGVYGATASLVATDSKDEEGPADIGGKAKKRKKSKSAKVTVGALDGFLVTPDAASSRTEFLNALDLRIAQRFLYSLTLVQRPKSDAESETGSYLDQRISRLPLLRRICMLCGLRIATREYDFQSPTPFTIDDIMALLPRIKESSSIEHTSDSEALVLPEASELLRTARRLADEGKFAQAVNAAQEAGGWLSDCVGMVHKDYRRVLNEIVSICMATGEYEQALPFAATNLTLSVQIDGLDSPEIVSQHIRLATVHLGLVSQLKETLAVLSVEIASGVEGDSGQHASPAQMEAMRTKLTVSQQATAECKRAAISHLLTAKYLIELIGGVQHPELVTIFLRLGTFLVDEDGQFQSGILCMISQVRQRLTDLVQYAQVTTLIAECFFKKGFLQQGVDYQRKIFKVMTDLFGVKDSRTVEAKTRLESYIRAVGQETSRQKTLKQQQLAKQVEHTIEHAQQGIEKKMENLTLIDKVGDNKAHSAIGTVKGQYLLDIESSEHSNAGGRKYHNYHHHAPHKKKHAPKKK